MENERQKVATAFLLEMKSFLAKHGATLGGCGCCGSPFVSIGDDVALDDVTVDADGASHRFFDQSSKQWVTVVV